MPSGGPPNQGIRPLNPNGQVGPNTYGTHRLHMEMLNVRNPRPGFNYYWCRRGSQARPDPMGYRLLMLGYRPVKATDPELSGQEIDPDILEALGGAQTATDVVLMRCPVDELRKRRDQSAAKSRALITEEEDQFLANVSAREQYYERGEPTRFRVRGHRHRTSPNVNDG